MGVRLPPFAPILSTADGFVSTHLPVVDCAYAQKENQEEAREAEENCAQENCREQEEAGQEEGRKETDSKEGSPEEACFEKGGGENEGHRQEDGRCEACEFLQEAIAIGGAIGRFAGIIQRRDCGFGECGRVSRGRKRVRGRRRGWRGRRREAR